jgi:hypothetical protein
MAQSSFYNYKIEIRYDTMRAEVKSIDPLLANQLLIDFLLMRVVLYEFLYEKFRNTMAYKSIQAKEGYNTLPSNGKFPTVCLPWSQMYTVRVFNLLQILSTQIYIIIRRVLSSEMYLLARRVSEVTNKQPDSCLFLLVA